MEQNSITEESSKKPLVTPESGKGSVNFMGEEVKKGTGNHISSLIYLFLGGVVVFLSLLFGLIYGAGLIYGIIALNVFLILGVLFKTILGIRIIKTGLINPEIKNHYKTITRAGYLLFLAILLQIFLLFIVALSGNELSPPASLQIPVTINFYILTGVYLFNYFVSIVSYFIIRKHNLSKPLNLVSMVIRGLPLILLIIFILDRTVVNIL